MRATRGEWRERVRAWRASGMPAGEFAAREGLNVRTLQWWSSTLRRESPCASQFVEVKMLTGAAIELVVRDVVVRVPTGFDAAELVRLVAALENR